MNQPSQFWRHASGIELIGAKVIDLAVSLAAMVVLWIVTIPYLAIGNEGVFVFSMILIWAGIITYIAREGRTGQTPGKS